MELKTPVGIPAPAAGASTPVIDDFIIRQISRAELLVGSGQIEEAIATLNEILKLNPDSTHAHMKLKDVYLRAGMKPQAAEECLQLARIYESQGERASANDYLVRARFLSPTTGNLSSKPRPIQPLPNGKTPLPPNGAGVAMRPSQPEVKTRSDSPRPVNGHQQAPAPVRPLPQSEPRKVADVISVPRPPAPAAPPNPSARNQVVEHKTPELPPDAGTRFLKTDLDEIRRAVLGEDLSAVSTPEHELPRVSPPDVVWEQERVEVITHVPTALAVVEHAAVATVTTSKLTTSPLVVKSSRRWIYTTAVAVVLLAGTAVGGGFWFNARLDKQYAALNREYEAAADASSYAVAQPETLEVVATDVIASDAQTPTDDVQPAREENQRKPEQDQADRRTIDKQPAQTVARLADTQLPSAVPTKTDARKASPLPPMPFQVPVTGGQPISDNRSAAVLMNAGSEVGPPEPPAPAPAPARKVVVSAEAVSKAQPSYPRSAVTAHVSGAVAVLVSINEQGNVTEARAISGPSLLWGAAVDAARRWKFKPSTIGGVAAKTSKTIVFNFKSDR